MSIAAKLPHQVRLYVLCGHVSASLAHAVGAGMAQVQEVAHTEPVCFSCSVELINTCRTQCTQEDGVDTQIPCQRQPKSKRPGRQPELILSHSACQYKISVDAAYSYLRLAGLMWKPASC